MINKQSYAVQMSFSVPDSEKRIAEKAEECFEDFISQIKIVNEYLDYIYDPFKKYEEIDSELINEYRRVFRDYRNEVNKKFKHINRRAHKCVLLMSEFNSDASTEEIMKAFVNTIRELDKYVNIFLSIFSNLNDKQFKDDLIASIDSIKKQSNQIKQLVNDRVLEHIQSNILAKNWASNFSTKVQKNIEERVPLIVELFKEREELAKNY